MNRASDAGKQGRIIPRVAGAGKDETWCTTHLTALSASSAISAVICRGVRGGAMGPLYVRSEVPSAGGKAVSRSACHRSPKRRMSGDVCSLFFPRFARLFCGAGDGAFGGGVGGDWTEGLEE